MPTIITDTSTALSANPSYRLQAYAAMLSCPVGSIRTYQPDPLGG